MKRRTTAVLFLVGLAISGCSQTAYRPQKTEQSLGNGLVEYLTGRDIPCISSAKHWQWQDYHGIEIRTPNYRLYTTLNDHLIVSQLPAFLEAAHKEYLKQIPQPVQTGSPFIVFLFETRDQWQEFTTQFATNPENYLRINRGAYVDKGISVAWFLGREQTFSVLAHEGWHQFSMKHFKYRLPSWLDEGIATLFEAPVYEGNRWRFEPDRNFARLGGLKRTILDGKLMSLSDILTLSPGQVLSEDAAEWRAFYSQVYALVRFLREDDYGKLHGNYQAMLNGGLYGTWPLCHTQQDVLAGRNPISVSQNADIGQALFEQYIGLPEGTLEEQYLNFCRKSTFRIKLKEVSVVMDLNAD